MSKARDLADLGSVTARLDEVGNSDGALSNRNKIINGNFGINQRGVSGTVTLSAGAYGHDRWKAGASGCTYAFATSANVTTITISAGSLVQVIEGLSLQSGTHVLSWTGTVQMKIGGGSAGNSGMTGTLTGGTNATVETSGTGTLSLVQLEAGDTATPFEHRSYGQELALCQRYCVSLDATSGPSQAGAGLWFGTTAAIYQIRLPVEMRAAPTLTNVSPTVTAYTPGSTLTSTAPTLNTSSKSGVEFYSVMDSGITTAGNGTSVIYTAGQSLLTAEL